MGLLLFGFFFFFNQHFQRPSRSGAVAMKQGGAQIEVSLPEPVPLG